MWCVKKPPADLKVRRVAIHTRNESWKRVLEFVVELNGDLFDILVEIFAGEVGRFEDSGQVVVEFFHEDGIGFVSVGIFHLAIHEVVEEAFEDQATREAFLGVAEIDIGEAVVVGSRAGA